MDFEESNPIRFRGYDICCCCLSGGCFKDIFTEYYVSGTKEVYGDMLKHTFDVEILNTTNLIKHKICEDCIEKLRHATAFKQMVINNKRSFKHYIEGVQNIEKGSNVEVKVENIKIESSILPDDSIDDDEILANMKLELSRNTPILDSSIERKHKQKAKAKCNVKPSDTGQPTREDWTKIIERRGSGPILRENSLKLLVNSTVCVFQWNRSRYRCFCCKEPYSDINLLREHTSSKHTLKNIEKKIISQQNRLVKVEISKITCKICDRNEENLISLREHLISTHNIRFASKQDLLVPFKIENELSCQICNEKFTVFRLLNIHMNKHYQNQVCHICGAGFSNLVFLNLHKSRSHKPLKCRQCKETFINKIDKKNHEVSIHNIKFERKLRFPCPYCDDRFVQENFRVQHLVTNHGFKRPEFKCNLCPKVFITKSLCNNHLKSVHMKEKSHECEVCHNFFYTKSDVTRHMVTHTGLKNFACGLCNNPFASKDSLRRHMKRTHVGVH